METTKNLTKSQEQILEQLRAEFMKINGQEKEFEDLPLGMLTRAVHAKIEREKYIKTMQETYDELLAKQSEKNIARLNEELKEFGLYATKSGQDIRVDIVEKKYTGNSFIIQQVVKREKDERFGDYVPCGIYYKSYSPAVESCSSFEEYLGKDSVIQKIKRLYDISLNQIA